MKEKTGLWQLAGFAATSLGGTLLHYLYDWTRGAWWAAPFSGVNESTWEHMKLLFWPLLLFAALERFFFRERSDFLCVKARGIVLGISLIPILFYTYNGVVGKSPDWINIAIFFVSCALAFLYETKALNRRETVCTHPHLAQGILLLLAALFVIFTYLPPEIGIFRDPVTNAYGIGK